MISDGLLDTIAAISTPIGESGIGIVRMSGKDALSIADKIFICRGHKKPSTFATYTTHYGWITKGQSKENIIDEVILTVMRAPGSYTRENIVEINCHGGIVALRAVLDLVLESGCRIASPGEFTKRAFLNGRLDLAQAEAVLDIIKAKTDAAGKLGIGQLRGFLSGRINKIREILIDILTTLEANIDFPDEEIGSLDFPGMRKNLKEAGEQSKAILGGARQGRVLREGISVVICGKPNVGKSSLINALLKQERSIVTPIPGTTRDTIEEIIDIKGIPVRIVDTAGIIEPRDLAEKKAVQRAKKYIASADLVIMVFDGSKRLSKEDEALGRALKRKTVIAVINKIDLKQKVQKETISKKFGVAIGISAKKARNIGFLEDAIANLVYGAKLNPAEPVFVSNLRHIESIKKAQNFIAEAVNSLDNKLPPEFAAESIRSALAYLDDILGKRFDEELLDKIFDDFCIGK